MYGLILIIFDVLITSSLQGMLDDSLPHINDNKSFRYGGCIIEKWVRITV